MNESGKNERWDLTQVTLGVIFILGLLLASLWILKPFLTALLWATMIVISTWPTLLSLERIMGGKRGPAAAVLTLGLLFFLIVPLAAASATLLAHLDGISGWIKGARTASIPPPPIWVTDLPLVGKPISEKWLELNAAGSEGLMAQIRPYAGRVVEWMAGMLGGFGTMVVQFVLIVIISGLLYVNGETAAGGVLAFARRLAGERGTKVALLAAGSIRGVAAGVLVTALIQTGIAGFGLVICSVPAAMILVSAILVLCLAQLGPTLVMVAAVAWKFHTGDALWGGVLVVFTVISGGIDSFIRPVLIRRGADLPLVLIFAGVLGGMISAGIMGIFVGPVILAVTHTLLKDWVASDRGLTVSQSDRAAFHG
jgi:predicted PurR-regulated permease PerM